MPKMRAKLQVSYVQEHFSDPEQKTKSSETLVMHAVCRTNGYSDTGGSDEDNTYAMYSPQADFFRLTVANPALWGQFKAGQKFYVDFTEAE